jgi:hypothetical protein
VLVLANCVVRMLSAPEQRRRETRKSEHSSCAGAMRCLRESASEADSPSVAASLRSRWLRVQGGLVCTLACRSSRRVASVARCAWHRMHSGSRVRAHGATTLARRRLACHHDTRESTRDNAHTLPPPYSPSGSRRVGTRGRQGDGGETSRMGDESRPVSAVDNRSGARTTAERTP